MERNNRPDEGQQDGLALGETPAAQAICGLCGVPLLEGRDDLYAELCVPCGQRKLKGRRREAHWNGGPRRRIRRTSET